jgi:phosphoribosylanthranilate isomerase
MTWVKVCGLSTVDDVTAAVRAGADAVGFVTHPGSPRYVSLPLIEELAAGVPITTVVLTVDLGVAAAMTAIEATGASGIQPYGVHARAIAEAAVAGGLTVLYPVRAAGGIGSAPAGTIPLVDTPDMAVYGGTGRTFDWKLLDDVEADYVLAGGLGPDNVAAAVRQMRPWGVDASSGLEGAPGIKDAGKVAAFVQEAKQA